MQFAYSKIHPFEDRVLILMKAHGHIVQLNIERTFPSLAQIPGTPVLPLPFLYLQPLATMISFSILMCMCVLVTQSCLTLCNPMDELTRHFCPWSSPGENTGVGCPSLLQGISPTEQWNMGFLHCTQILYHLNYQGSLSILIICLLHHSINVG